MRALHPGRNLDGQHGAGWHPRAPSNADFWRLCQDRGGCYALGFLRRSIKRDCLPVPANGKSYSVGQLDEHHAGPDLLNMLVNVGAGKKSISSKLAHDHEGLENSVRGDFHRELHDAHCIKAVI